jgi:muramoyltetrapeptide carboxypeptidase LdcA involved in peptidoglycan recycling
VPIASAFAACARHNIFLLSGYLWNLIHTLVLDKINALTIGLFIPFDNQKYLKDEKKGSIIANDYWKVKSIPGQSLHHR